MNSDIECFKCHNFGHKKCDYRIRMEPFDPNRNEQSLTQHEENTKVWKKIKEKERCTSLNEENNLSLHA